MRSTASLLALLAALLLCAACGDDAAVIRVQILTAPADGPVDVPLALLHAGPDRTLYPLRAVPGAEPGVMQAEAPSGFYFIHSPPGWEQLRVKPDAFEFVADASLAPRSVYVGKAGAFYVSMRDQDLPAVGMEWALERVEPDGRRTPIPIEVFPAFDKVVGIRPPRAQWRGQVRLTGRRVDGRLLNPVEVDLGTPGPDRPRVRLVITAPASELGVRLVAPAGAPGVAEGYPVRIRVVGIPLEYAIDANAQQGVVGFPMVPRVPEGVQAEAGPTRLDFPGTYLDARRALHLLALDDGSAALCGLTWPAGADVDEVRVRPGGRRQYARAQLLPVDGGRTVQVRTCTGPQRWLVRSGTRWAELEMDVKPAGGEAQVETWIEGALASGDVRDLRRGAARPLPPGHRLLFVRTEGEEQVLGEGFDYAIDATGRYRVQLPPGQYTVRVQGARGLVGSPVPLELVAGVNLRRAFDVE